MSKKKNDINTHVGMSGVEDVVDNMEKIGDAGDKTAKRVKKSSQKASKGLQTMDHAAKEVRVTIEKLGGNAGRLGNFLSKLGPGGIAAAAGIGAVALAMHRGLPLYIKTEESLQRFGATLEFAGKHAGISAKEVEDFANAMEKSTRVSADQVMNASSTLLAFDRIQGETLMRTQEAAINLSQVLGRDLQGITEKLGRAMQLPLEEMKALKEVGITISLSEEERIRRMVEANDILGAQDAILSKIEDKVGNVAHQLGTEGIGASFHQMGVAYEDALKSFISFVDYAIDLKGITESIADTLRGLTDTFQTLSDQTIETMEQERKKLEVTIATLKQSEEAGNKEAKERLAYVQIEHDHMSKLIPLKEKHMNLEKRIASFQQFKKHGLIKGEGSTKIKEFISGLKKEFESLSQQIDALNKKKLSLLQKEGEKKHQENAKQFIQTKLAALEKERKLLGLSKEEQQIHAELEKITVQARTEGLALTKEQLAELEKAVRQKLDAAKVQEGDHKVLQAINKDYEKQIRLVGLSERERKGVEAQEKAIAAAASQNLDITKESVKVEIERAQALALTLHDRTKAEEKLREDQKKLAELAQEPFKTASANIQTSLAQSIEQGLTNGFKNGEDILDQFGNTIKQTLISAASNAIAANITSSFIQPGNSTSLSSSPSLFSNLSSLGSLLQGSSLTSNAQGAPSAGNAGGGLFGLSSLGGLFGSGAGSAGTSLLGSAGSFLGMAGMGAGIGNMTSSFTGSNSGAGSALGAVGGAIGSIYGPIGFVAGSAIGGALGGMIGGDPSSNISEFLGTTTNNGLQNVSFGSKNMGTDAAEELAATFSQVIRSFEQSGIDIGNHQVIGSIHSGGSSFKVEESGIHIGFDSNDAESVNSAMATLSVELARLADISNNSLSIALENITTEGRSLEEVLSDLSFAAHFDELGGAEEQLGQFAQAATQLHEQMGHAQDTATRLGLSLEHLEGLQTEQLNEFFDGLIGIQDVLSPTEQAIEALATRFDDLREAAEITGYSVESINEAQARDEAILRGNFVRDLTNAWLQETDPMLASINALQQDYQQQLRDAQLLGISDIALIHELHYERMTDLAEQSGFLQEELAEGNNTLLLEQRQIQDDLVTSLQEQSRTAQTLISQYQSISSSVDRFLSQSEFGAASFDTPLTQFQKIEAQFKQLLPQAQLGNIEAQQQLIEIAPLFRDLNRSVHGATAEGAANALELTTAMENVGDVADRQVSLQEQLISQHSIELSTLQGIETGTDGVIQSVNQMSSAVIAQFNQFFSSYQGGSTQDFGINAALNRQLAEVTGFRDNFGGGSFIQFMQTMNDNDPRRQAARQVMSTSGFIPGFANGGQPPIGTPFWVGEYGPELMVARSQHQVYSNTQSHQMVQQGSESPAMVSRLDNLISLNLELLDLLRQGQRVEQKQLDDIGDSLHGIHRQSKRGVRV